MATDDYDSFDNYATYFSPDVADWNYYGTRADIPYDEQVGQAIAEAQKKFAESGLKLGDAKSLFQSILDKASTPAGIATGIAGIYSMMGGNKPQVAGYKGSIPKLTATREMIAQPEYKPYSGQPVMGRQYFAPVKYEPVSAAKGGEMPPRYLRGETDGMADKIETSIDGSQPARLSHGEFVIPADVVSHLGNGNSDAGADVLYRMMDKVRKARTGSKDQGKKINPDKFTPGGIAYAQGGQVEKFATGGTSTANPFAASPYGSSAATSLSEFAGPYVADMLGKGMALSQTPYQAYTGPLSAGYSPLQESFYSGLGKIGFPSTLGQSFTDTGVMQRYMNPFMEQILNPQLQAIQRQGDIQRAALGPSRMRGGFGARSDLMDRQLNADIMRQKAQTMGQGLGQAYMTGLGQFNVEQNQARSIADMLSAAGTQQRDIEQQGITAQKAQFEEERKFPYAQLQFAQSLLQGLPIGTTSYTPNITGISDLTQRGKDLATLYDMILKATKPQ